MFNDQVHVVADTFRLFVVQSEFLLVIVKASTKKETNSLKLLEMKFFKAFHLALIGFEYVVVCKNIQISCSI